MKYIHSFSSNSADLARIIAALANSGGGEFIIETHTECKYSSADESKKEKTVENEESDRRSNKKTGNSDYYKISETFQNAINEILPPPVLFGNLPGLERDRESASGILKNKTVLQTGIFSPAEIFLSIKDEKITAEITPGISLCTVKGEVFVIDNRETEEKKGEKEERKADISEDKTDIKEKIKALTLSDIIRISGSGG